VGLGGRRDARLLIQLSDKRFNVAVRLRIGPRSPALAVDASQRGRGLRHGFLDAQHFRFEPVVVFALAMADRSVFATNRADLRGTTRARPAPAARSALNLRTISRIFCADMRTLRVIGDFHKSISPRLRRVGAVLSKIRVGENSPSDGPPCFRHNTGLNTLPLCTVNVSPTKSGVITERRDQVLIASLTLSLSPSRSFPSNDGQRTDLS